MRAKPVNEADDMFDEGIEVELSGGQRNIANVVPVSDVDIVVAQQGLYRSP